MSLVYLGLGSNIGDKENFIKKALDRISKLSTIQKISPLYLTEPVGPIVQEWFLNCVVVIETEHDPMTLLTSLKSIERTLGRKKTIKSGPRCIDIDILFYDDRIMTTRKLVIPHPLLHERLFVLQPMMDLAPHYIHPLLKKSIQELYKSRPWSEKVVLYK